MPGYSINTTPLLQECDSDEENQVQNDAIVVVGIQKPLFKPTEPLDKFNVAYVIFYLLGVVTLLPWNFYVTADDYWMYKFRDVTKNNSVGVPAKRTPLQAEFTSYVSLASSVPNVIFLVFNTAISHRVSLNTRIIGSLVCMLGFMTLTLIFVLVDTDKWQNAFFVLTLTFVVMLNVCSAILSGSVFGVVGRFSPAYITATIGGQALGGIFAAVTEIISLSVGASSVHSALVYFTIANLTIIISIILYIVLIRTVFFNYHVIEKLRIIDDVGGSSSSSEREISHKVILSKIWIHGFCMFLVFAITLAVYPGITVLVESEGKGHGNKWNDVFFVPTISYLLFSVGDYLGRLLAGKIQKPRNGTYLLILTSARFIFIPLIMLCNAQPRHHMAVVFDRDYHFILILAACALSNGYLANLLAICAPKVVDIHEKEVASSIITVFLGVGLTLGSAICLIMVKIL